MHASWFYTLGTIILLAATYPSVTAQRHAVLPRQDAISETETAASSSPTPRSSITPSSNPPTSTATSPKPSASDNSQVDENNSASETGATSVETTISSGIVLGPMATPIVNTTLNDTVTTTSQIDGLPIKPEITPALSVAGALLILTGAFYTMIGIKTKWLHNFLSTAYLFSLAVTVLVIYVMHPPVSNAIQGAYFVAACVTGIIFGAVAIVFADVTEGLGCVLGGFSLSMWFLVLKPGGLVTSTTGKAIFIACFTVGTFSLYISHYTRPYGLIGSTSFGGATVVVLGVDMFSRAGLKEFWLYIWDLNDALFPLRYEGPYPITRGIRVEIACTILLFLLGIMSQMKVWKIIKQRREQRAADQRHKDQEQDQTEEDLGRRLEEGNNRDRSLWETIYGSKQKGKGSPVDSGIGTEEPSTRKGSLSVAGTQEAPAAGMEMQNLTAASRASQDNRRVTVHIAQDDFIVPLPSPSGEQSIKSAADSYKEPLINNYDPQPITHKGAASESSSIKSYPTATNKDPPTLIDPNLTLKPKFVPLPFKVPAETSHNDDDKSSVATFAASDQLLDRTPNRLLGSSLIRKVSGRSKRKSNVARKSQEALMIPHIEDDRASSVAATMDGVSIYNSPSREALSLGDHGPTLLEPKADATTPDSKHSPLLKAMGLTSSETTQEPRGSAESAAPRIEKADEGGYFAGLTDLKTNDTTNPNTTPLAQSVNAMSEASEQRATGPSLANNLPEGDSKVVMQYRTNEWAKHLDSAESPEFEDIKIGKAPPAIPADVAERAAPVNVRALQQTPLTAEPAPLVTKSSKAIDDRSQLPSSDRSGSRNSNNPYLHYHPSPRQSPPTSNTNLAKPNMDRTPSQTSLSSSNSREDPSSRAPLAKSRLSQSSITQARGFRSSSSPMLGTPIAESPIEEGVESSFPARFTPSPMHLMSQRDSIVRSKPSSTTLLGRNTPPSVNRNTSANFSNAVTPTINENDDIPLSQRKSLLQQQPSPQQQRTVSGSSTPYYTPAATPLDMTRNSSRMSLNPVRPSGPQQRDSTISAWRASLAQDPSNTTNITNNAEIEQRRLELLAEKRRTRDSQVVQEKARGARDSVVNKEMRRGSMLDAHREAMRKMQGEVNKTLTNGTSS